MSLTLSPSLRLGEAGRLNLDATCLGGRESGETRGIRVYALELHLDFGSAVLRGAALVDTARYAITTPEYGSTVEEIAHAIEKGHDYYPNFDGFLSIDVRGSPLSSRRLTLVASAYFQDDSTSLFSWAMARIEAHLSPSDTLSFAADIEVTRAGAEGLGFRIEALW